MPGLMDLLGGELPPIQQTQASGAPGINTNAAPAMPSPGLQAPPAPQPPPSLWQRIQQNLMPTPQGLASLVSGDDLGRARNRGLLDFGLSMLANSRGQGGGNAPGFGQALQAGVGAMRQGFGDSVNQTVQGNVQGMQLSQQKAIMQGRQAIGQFIKSNVTGDRENDLNVLRKAYMMYGATNDMDMMKSLSPLLEKDPAMEFHAPMDIDAGDHRLLVDPRTGRTMGSVPINPKPIDPDMLEQRRERLQIAAMEAGMRGDALTQQKINSQLHRETEFSTNYRADPDIKYGTSVAQVASQLNAVRPRALAQDPFAQFQAIEGALRLRNPEMNRAPSPADYRTLASSLGLKGKAFAALANFQQGSILPQEAMQRLYDTSDDLVRQGRQRFNTARGGYMQRMGQFNLDPQLAPDVFRNVPDAQPTRQRNPLMEGTP